MDNPQYYQPLSHALNPPRTAQGHYSSTVYKPASGTRPEEDDSDDDDEGMVEEQLNRNDQGSDPSPSSPRQKPTSTTEASRPSTSQPVSPLQETEPKRRPGRPRGSKNRRARASTSQTASKSQPPQPSHPPLHPTGQGTNPPQLPEVNAQNQQYYEFQWRVLNLCAEFYGAAEELVKATPALVIAQCYQMGPGSKVDPISMLSEAKRNCDTLLANPSRLISSPPPPMYPVAPPLYQPAAVGTIPPAPGSSSKSTAPPTVINQPQSFIVSMGTPTAYPVYASAPPHYPTASYYQYSYAHPGTAYYAAAPPTQAAPSAQTSQPSTQPTATVPSSVSGVGNQGSWSDDETERLRKLAEEHKGSSGEIDWDRVVSQWGSGRTRHQILIKATQIGLKESSTGRGVKRRRETEGSGEAGSPPTPSATTVAAPTSTSSPSSTPVPSPSIQNQQRPTSKAATSSVSITPAPTTASSMPWPMPTVAATEHRSTSYYRPRPTETSSKPSSGTQLGTSHHYMYQPNGRQESSK